MVTNRKWNANQAVSENIAISPIKSPIKKFSVCKTMLEPWQNLRFWLPVEQGPGQSYMQNCQTENPRPLFSNDNISLRCNQIYNFAPLPLRIENLSFSSSLQALLSLMQDPMKLLQMFCSCCFHKEKAERQLLPRRTSKAAAAASPDVVRYSCRCKLNLVSGLLHLRS